MTRHREFLLRIALALLALLGSDASAKIWQVDRLDDAIDSNVGDTLCATTPGGCSLRAAVQEANALPGVDEIRLPPGFHNLTLMDEAPEEAAASGDLDILEPLHIVGLPGEPGTVAIGYPFVLHSPDGERVFDIATGNSDVPVQMHRVVVHFGKAHDLLGGGGVLVRAGSAAVLDEVDLYANGADRRGNALAVYGRVEVRRSHIFDNHPSWTSLPADGGGGIYVGVGGRLMLDQVGLDSNVHAHGGSILADGPSTIAITRSTLIDSGTAALTLRGAVQMQISDSTLSHAVAIQASDGASITLDQVTLNHVDDSVRIVLQGEATQLTIANSILNRRFADVETCLAKGASVSSRGGNVFQFAAPCGIAPDASDRITNALLLEPLRVPMPFSRFFPEQRLVFAPTANSAAINAGVTANCSAFDQLGTLRHVGPSPGQSAHCEAGAIEIPILQLHRDSFE